MQVFCYYLKKMKRKGTFWANSPTNLNNFCSIQTKIQQTLLPSVLVFLAPSCYVYISFIYCTSTTFSDIRKCRNFGSKTYESEIKTNRLSSHLRFSSLDNSVTVISKLDIIKLASLL